jgi:MFS family permease
MPFEAFKERDYRNFWLTQFISNIGSWMQAVAQGWLVYRLTESPFLLGFVGFANSIPTFFLMLPGGVIADRFDRRRVVSASQWAQALCALFLALSIRTHQISVWQIIAAAIVTGVAMSFSAPAWQAMVIDLLDDRSRLANAVAMNSLQFNLSRVIGPLVAALTLSAWGSFWCFLFNALSFLPLIFILGRVTARQKRHDDATTRMLTRIADGFRYVRGDRVIVLMLAVVGAATMLGYPYTTLMPMAARLLYGHDDARGLGILMGAIGAGALIGSLSIALRMPPRKLPSILANLALFGAALCGLALTQNRIAVLALLAVAGGSVVVCVALCNTAIQQRVPDAMRGRVLSMYTFAFFGFLPFGNLLAGSIAEHRGLPLTMLAMGTATMLCAVAGFALRLRE